MKTTSISRLAAPLLGIVISLSPVATLAYVTPDEVFEDNDASEVLYYQGNIITDVTEIEKHDLPVLENPRAEEAADYAGLYLVSATVLLFGSLYIATRKHKQHEATA